VERVKKEKNRIIEQVEATLLLFQIKANQKNANNYINNVIN
jgi:hypothetical protein